MLQNLLILLQQETTLSLIAHAKDRVERNAFDIIGQVETPCEARIKKGGAYFSIHDFRLEDLLFSPALTSTGATPPEAFISRLTSALFPSRK
jgi:hypothetical protein